MTNLCRSHTAIGKRQKINVSYAFVKPELTPKPDTLVKKCDNFEVCGTCVAQGAGLCSLCHAAYLTSNKAESSVKITEVVPTPPRVVEMTDVTDEVPSGSEARPQQEVEDMQPLASSDWDQVSETSDSSLTDALTLWQHFTVGPKVCVKAHRAVDSQEKIKNARPVTGVSVPPKPKDRQSEPVASAAAGQDISCFDLLNRLRSGIFVKRDLIVDNVELAHMVPGKIEIEVERWTKLQTFKRRGYSVNTYELLSCRECWKIFMSRKTLSSHQCVKKPTAVQAVTNVSLHAPVTGRSGSSWKCSVAVLHSNVNTCKVHMGAKWSEDWSKGSSA
ncbi:hypothetical protein EDB85DRAFT_1890356 [Lactarius pseudohatsudake]|nr:hypothetical protein EDB85DRAFT_1890356 [Lactarius pseudohatsudake]